MIFFVTTVLEKHDDLQVAGDVFYQEERIVRIADIEHSLVYGDTVRHGDFSYYINEETISRTAFDNQFDEFWYLRNGDLPEDNKSYYLIVDQNLRYSSDLSSLMMLEGTIIRRSDIGYSSTEIDSELIHCKRTGRSYLVDDLELQDITEESRERFGERLEEAAEQKRQDMLEDEHLIALVSETAAELIEKPADGQHGIDGNDGRDGIDGVQGPAGARGIDGRDGARGYQGPKGERGIQGAQGTSGTDGKNGIDGKPGSKGATGKTGAAGKDGLDGAPGPKGDTGEKGEKGDAGPVTIIDESKKYEKKYKKISSEWEKFRKMDQAYKQRLNIQLGSLGGGGSTKILDNDDVVFNYPSQLANNDFLVFDNTVQKFVANNLVTIINTIKADLEMQYDRLVDEQVSGSDSLTYIGETAPGGAANAAVWRIKLVTEYANSYTTILWANNTDTTDKIWDDRGTYTYDV